MHPPGDRNDGSDCTERLDGGVPGGNICLGQRADVAFIFGASYCSLRTEGARKNFFDPLQSFSNYTVRKIQHLKKMAKNNTTYFRKVKQVRQ